VNKPRDLVVRILKFGVVGVSGVVVNLGIYAFLREYVEMQDFLARAIAIEISILNNFIWNFLWTWSDRGRTLKNLPDRLLKYHGSTFIASFIVTLGIGWLVLKLLPDMAMIDYISHTVGIAAGMVANFLLSDKWVFNSQKKK